jgi:hypothetical protein
VVYRANKLLPAPAAAPVLKVKARADYRSMTPVFFVDTPTTRDPISVTFVARNCSTCAWFKLGTDDAKPFQIPVMPEAWASKKSMQVAAISRTSNGKVAGGQIVTFFRAKVSP